MWPTCTCNPRILNTSESLTSRTHRQLVVLIPQQPRLVTEVWRRRPETLRRRNKHELGKDELREQ